MRARIGSDTSINRATTLSSFLSSFLLVIQVYWQGMIRLGLMEQMIYDYQLKQQLDLLFNYLA